MLCHTLIQIIIYKLRKMNEMMMINWKCQKHQPAGIVPGYICRPNPILIWDLGGKYMPGHQDQHISRLKSVYLFIVTVNLMLNSLLIGNQSRGGSNRRSRHQPDISQL